MDCIGRISKQNETQHPKMKTVEPSVHRGTTAVLQRGGFHPCDKRRHTRSRRPWPEPLWFPCAKLLHLRARALPGPSLTLLLGLASFSSLTSCSPEALLGDWWDLNPSVSRELGRPVAQRKHGVFVSHIKDARCRRNRAHRCLSHSTLFAGLVAPCCRD